MSNTKPFLILVVIALVIGGSLGGSFLGGVVVGEGRAPDANAPLSTGQALPTPQPQAGGALPSEDDLAALRERFQSGDLSQEDIEQIRSQFQGLAGQGGGGLAPGGGGTGGFGGGPLRGVIETIGGT